MKPEVKCKIEQKRRYRIRNKVKGTSSRPRMSVRFTERNIYVQFIDDEKGRTLASASTRHKTQENREKLAANKVAAEKIGKTAAEVAKVADGVIVGSALVSRIAEHCDAPHDAIAEIKAVMTEIRQALDA